MNEVTCRCGAIKKNFRISIPFFIAECCEAAGYDHLGNKLEPESVGLKAEEVKELVESAPALEVQDEGEQPESEEPKEEVKSSRKRRKKDA